MHSWNLPLEKLDALTLASDVRLSQVDYCNDQIWELKVTKGAPARLMLNTTLGLRARSFFMFPQFSESSVAISDPAVFAHPPTINVAYPNFARLNYSPFKEIDVISDYWLADSQCIAGRLKITNSGSVPRLIRLEWAALLTPGEKGRRMAGVKMHGAWILSGETEDLSPVIFMSGGVESGNIPYPALYLAAMLRPGETHDFIWAEVALANRESSFELARQIASRNWDAEYARIEMVNATQIEIETGDPDWNTAFTLSQQIALKLLISANPSHNTDSINTSPPDIDPNKYLPDPSLVLTRHIDQGFSRRGDGSDYSHTWAGQTPLDAYYFANIVMPGAAIQVKGLLRNFLAIQNQENGFIDWKAGLAGQRSQLLATPVLASLTWKYYQATNDKPFLEEVFPGLLHFFQIWFTQRYDLDRDGSPEWEDLRQIDFESHPVFDRWQLWSQGADLACAESPSLNAFLFQEATCLIQMAETLGKNAEIPPLEEKAEKLSNATASTWEPVEGQYQYRDRDTHLSPQGEPILNIQGSADQTLDLPFLQPVRLVARVHTTEGAVLHPVVTFVGLDISNSEICESIPAYDWQYGLHTASVTSRLTYSRLKRVQIQDVDQSIHTSIASVNYHYDDLSLLLPMWAGMPTPEQARILLDKAIKNPQRFGLPYGLPLWPKISAAGDIEPIESKISITLNLFVCEGLLRYSFRIEAAELFTRIMTALSQALRHQKSFFEHYHAETGRGVGEHNALGGLAPVGLFLEILGVTLISPWRVKLTGKNPFPWPVTIRYRGLKIYREAGQTTVTFPDEQITTITDPSDCVVALENKHG